MQIRTFSIVFVLAVCLDAFGSVEGMIAQGGAAVAAPAKQPVDKRKRDDKDEKEKPRKKKESDDEDEDDDEPLKKKQAPKKKKAAVPTGYVYMNVLGPHTTPGLAVVKIGKASTNTLADRMRVENNAARQLSVQGQWPFGGGRTVEASTAIWRRSFDPARAQNAIPYVKTFTNLNAAETAVRDAWANTDQAVALGEAQSLAWFASVARVHDPNPLRGSIVDFGATQELVAVRWSAIAHVVAAGQAAGEAGWTLDACLEAIAGYAAPAGHPEATPAGWGPQGAAQVRAQAHDALYEFERFLHAELGNVNGGNLAAFVALMQALQQQAQQVLHPPPPPPPPPAQPVAAVQPQAAQQGGPPPLAPNAPGGDADQ